MSASHNHHCIDMNRHLEDLDNRGRRNNICVRGIPETVEYVQIIPALQRVFSSLLERQEDMEIDFVRAHTALRPKGPDTAPPCDIICCLQSFTFKEEIMRKARKNLQIIFNGANIMLFQDLSQITLRNRRALHPPAGEIAGARDEVYMEVSICSKSELKRSPAHPARTR